MLQIYVPVGQQRQLGIPLIICNRMGLEGGDWLHIAVGADRNAVATHIPQRPRPGTGTGPWGHATSHRVERPVLQTCARIGVTRRWTAGTDLCEAMGLQVGSWLLMKVLNDDQLGLDQVPPDLPEAAILRGASAFSLSGRSPEALEAATRHGFPPRP